MDFSIDSFFGILLAPKACRLILCSHHSQLPLLSSFSRIVPVVWFYFLGSTDSRPIYYLSGGTVRAALFVTPVFPGIPDLELIFVGRKLCRSHPWINFAPFTNHRRPIMSLSFLLSPSFRLSLFLGRGRALALSVGSLFEPTAGGV